MSNISAVMNRIQEIETRIASLSPPHLPTLQGTGNGGQGTVNTAFNAQRPHDPMTQHLTPNKPFDVMLAKIGGGVSFRPIGGAAFKPDLEGLIAKYAGQNGLSPEIVRALIQQESSGDPHAVSAAGAQGLMQLMPATGRAYGVTNPFDPEQNIAAGTRHFAGLLREFGGDMEKALAAYNAGSGAVKRHNGVPPYAETQNYVRRILQMANGGR
jgi:soluble lytic murein transglycosylase-like protein